MNYQQEEKELCIMDYVWSVLLHWRRIMFFMILFAFSVAGLKYIKDIQTLQTVKENVVEKQLTVEEIEDKIKQLPEKDKYSVRTAIDLIETLNKKNMYADSAAAMQLDCYNVDRIVLQYFIKTDIYTSELMHAYEEACLSPQAIDEIVQASGNTFMSNDVKDMIGFRNGGNNRESSGISNTFSIEGETAIFSITIRGVDRISAESTAEVIKNILDRYEVQAAKIFGSHSLILVSECYENGKDDSIESIQDSIDEDIYYLNERINVIKKGLLGEEAEEAVDDINSYITAIRKENENERTEKIVEDGESITKVSVSKKWILIGAILGVVFVCGLEFLYWIGNGRLNSVNELQQNFPVRILGVLEDRKIQKSFSKIDGWIYKLKDRNKKRLNRDQMFQMILSGIVVAAQKANIKEIYVTGTEIERKNVQSFLEKLKQAAEELEVKLVIGQSINIDSKAFFKMVRMGNVIIIEEVNVSIYQEIIRELQICEEQGVNILGSIVVEH